MIRKNKANYLEYIPVPKAELQYEMCDGNVTIYHENKGLFNYLAQKMLHKPAVSQVHLDTMGNYIWPLMDGQNDILAIAAKVKDTFGDDAEPLYARIVKYFKLLDECGFIELNSKSYN